MLSAPPPPTVGRAKFTAHIRFIQRLPVDATTRQTGVKNVLEELRRMHRELLGLISEHETMTLEAAPPAGLALARYRLLRASSSRTRFLEASVYPVAIGNASGAQLDGVVKLGGESIDLLLRMVAHVGKWDMPHIRACWPEYRGAAHKVAAEMRARIAAEQQILYPLLTPTE